MKIRLITIGKIKDKELQILINSYIEKISHYCNIEIISIRENNFLKNPNIEEQNIILKNESDLIKKYLIDSYNISLCIEGKQIDSIEFSNKIKKLEDIKNYKYINFIIGSSHGLEKKIKDESNDLLSFSKMTFTHQMMQYILLEQIFRAFKIIKNEKYHK
ncbi:MAG: 23S rRNA (pseudouridine(1915)-N(3))-methyltransferase RlmH [Mycoplasmoidaceae bacterium]